MVTTRSAGEILALALAGALLLLPRAAEAQVCDVIPELCADGGDGGAADGGDGGLDADGGGVDGAADAGAACDGAGRQGQPDHDGDGVRDACDEDDDGDGHPDAEEIALGTDPLDADDFPRLTGGGCSAGAPSTAAFVGLLAAGLLHARRRRRSRARTAALALALALPAAARAQAADLAPAGFDLRTFHPGFAGRVGAAVEGTATLLPLDFGVELVYDFSRRPLELSNGKGQRIGGVIDAVHAVDARLALGLPLSLELGLAGPVVLRQADAHYKAALDGVGVGDISASIKWAPLDAATSPVGLAVTPTLFFPTGDAARLSGSGAFGAEVKLAAEARLRPELAAAAHAGFLYRSAAGSFEGATLHHRGIAGLALAYRTLGSLDLVGEVDGGLEIGGAVPNPLELEARALARWTQGGISVMLGGGLGLSDAVGVPDFRVLTGVGFVNYLTRDADSDGIPDGEDRCPAAAEDLDGFQDGDGCPDEDNDGDGVLDAVDRCPMNAEDFDGYQDEDGCPDEDNDGDGVPDSIDRCPNQAEDKDGFQDDDGCMEEDNDGDGLRDFVDKCPNEPETENGHDDDDGCPDQVPPLGFSRGERFVFSEEFAFGKGSDRLPPDCEETLDKIRASLEMQPAAKLLVEGHTDDRGKPAANLALSKRRAQAVLDALVARGVDASRLRAEGVGDARPIASNATLRGRAQNNRIEIVVLDE